MFQEGPIKSCLKCLLIRCFLGLVSYDEDSGQSDSEQLTQSLHTKAQAKIVANGPEDKNTTQKSKLLDVRILNRRPYMRRFPLSRSPLSLDARTRC